MSKIKDLLAEEMHIDDLMKPDDRNDRAKQVFAFATVTIWNVRKQIEDEARETIRENAQYELDEDGCTMENYDEICELIAQAKAEECESACDIELSDDEFAQVVERVKDATIEMLNEMKEQFETAAASDDMIDDIRDKKGIC